MDIQELMIGDFVSYVRCAPKVIRVYDILEDGINTNWVQCEYEVIEGEYLEPIPLTEEILLSNDLVKDMRYGYLKKDNSFGVFHSYDGEEGFSIISGYNEKPYKIELPRPIRYVHELQRILRCVGLRDLANTFKI